ncbi:MAG: HPF/RaiA family ribosome-associated protein [Kofleriaceae bacterium]
MPIPTEITFHGIDPSAAVEASVMRWVARLEHVFDRIENCHVVIDQPHKRHRHGREFHITITLEVPGKNIAVSHIGHEDIYVAVGDAFRAARRQLLSNVEIRRGFVKRHQIGRPISIVAKQ